jgi:hypothetical protein
MGAASGKPSRLTFVDGLTYESRMVAAVVVLALLAAAPAAAADRPLDSARLGVSERATGASRWRFASKDHMLPVPQIGGSDDPSLHGLRIEISSATAGTISIDVPGGLGSPGWTARQTGLRRSYRYRNPAAPAGPSPVRMLTISEGRGITVDLRLSAGLPSVPVSVRITAGSLRACTRFDATKIFARRPSCFVARTVVPTVPDCSDASLDVRPLVWLFGDSNTGLYCPLVFAQHPEWNVACLGIGGETTVVGMSRLSTALANATIPPHVVLIAEGVNDEVGRGYDYDLGACTDDPSPQPESVNARLTDMAASVRAVGAVPIVSTMLYTCPVLNSGCLALPPDDPDACPGLRCFFDGACALSDLVRATQDPWVDFVIPPDQFADVLHPTLAGRHILADRASAAVTEVLSSLQ